MDFQITHAPTTDIQPLSLNITLTTEDDYRWFYHLMNMQAKEIVKGYDASSKGPFGDRFVDFTVPDKKELFRAIRAACDDQGVDVKL